MLFYFIENASNFLFLGMRGVRRVQKVFKMKTLRKENVIMRILRPTTFGGGGFADEDKGVTCG